MVAHVEFSKSVSDGPAVKARNDLARIGVDVVDVADIAVLDLVVHCWARLLRSAKTDAEAVATIATMIIHRVGIALGL
jgi:hypothetical protein